MEIILLENIENLGALGDKVNVKAGFARNYLLPKGKGKPATAANLEAFEKQRAELEKIAAAALAAAEARKAAIEALGTVQITAKIGSEGKLFGSIGTADIADALEVMGGAVEKREIRLPEGSLRMTGEHEVDIHLYTDVDVTIIVNITGAE
ncbi:MAG: 50S ribosomal protein L9 [Gammaproteobacteria bacterium]|nr:50S ribosomal protein L9 [Gammaproteobacteria bacterium]